MKLKDPKQTLFTKFNGLQTVQKSPKKKRKSAQTYIFYYTTTIQKAKFIGNLLKLPNKENLFGVCREFCIFLGANCFVVNMLTFNQPCELKQLNSHLTCREHSERENSPEALFYTKTASEDDEHSEGCRVIISPHGTEKRHNAEEIIDKIIGKGQQRVRRVIKLYIFFLS